MSGAPAWSRRAFVRVGAAAGGGLLVAVSVPGGRRLLDGAPAGEAGSPGAPGELHPFGAFLAVDTEGGVLVTIPVPEIGQGVRTSLAMIVAEELDAPWEAVRVRQADAADAADDLGPHPAAAGSQAIRLYWEPLRRAGAAARASLVAAAGARWGVDPASLDARDGRVVAADGRRELGYGTLAADAARTTLPAEPALKDPADFRIVGRPTPHLDAPDIVRGAATFGLDVRVPGMLRAAVARCPAYGGTPSSWDDGAARRVAGYRRAVPVEPVGGAPGRPYARGGVAAVADTTWSALRARDALEVRWNEGPNTGEHSADIEARAAALLDRPALLWAGGGRGDGDGGGARLAADLDASARSVEATYRTPFIAHATLEPMNCVARVEEDRCEVWAPTQVPVVLQRNVAALLDLPQEAVTVHVTRIGGGFGRRLSVDYALEAVQVARAVGAPVQVVWSREDDMRHSHLRPFNLHRLRAGVDDRGRLTAWMHRQAGTSRYAFREGRHPGHSEFRAGTWPAAFAPAWRLEYALVESALDRGPLRAPGHNTLTFAVESFLDEVAHAAGRDPLAFRLDVLAGAEEVPYGDGDPVFESARMARVLERAAEAAGWGRTLPAGRGMGVAGAFVFGSYCAHVVEVAVEGGRLRVLRAWSAVDCGRAVNPNGVRAQVEGGFMDGLGASLHQEITVEGGAVRQGNFHDFPLLRGSEAPEIEVHVIRSGRPPTGAGEPPYTPVGAAVANAIFAATGRRLRSLPLAPALAAD